MIPEPWRIAQIVADCGPGSERSLGSGYLVAPGLVLTASHVLAGASRVQVRLDVGQPTEVYERAETWWTDLRSATSTDLAVVVIPEQATAGRGVKPSRFGRISDTTAALAAQAFGFPRFKLRADPAEQGEPGVFRDLEQVSGHAPVAANRRQGTLAIYLDDPAPAAAEAGASPWEGMSGAAVWVAGRIVAVIAEHHASEGTGRLTARRIDRAYEDLPTPELSRLATWLQLPSAVDVLPDVVPAEAGQLVRSAYLEQVRDIAPSELIGRDRELAEWAEFCAGPDAYTWWQAGPWSGKTALASWFVTHPPAGIDVVSFFITGRLAGQADSDSFLTAMIEQLSGMGSAEAGSAALAGAVVGTWLSLLASAATGATERARRLVIVVDGLDEDESGAVSVRGRPSIASLLPRHPPSGVRVVVTSRPDPGLPDDVSSDHPLRTCAVRHLPVSGIAQDLERRAKQELRDLLTGEQTAVDVTGYIAGSGGGLTIHDLATLTAAPPFRLELIVRGASGRSLMTRAAADFPDDAPVAPARVYLFAHETLRVTAEEQLGNDLIHYREGIHHWIDGYASRDWPTGTPSYAIRGYPRMLVAIGDVSRLSDLVRNPRRHAFLQQTTGSDYAALAEIRSAQALLAGQEQPDLQALVELAVYRHAISVRNKLVPIGLPAVWARLGRIKHAEALARTISNPYVQGRVLADVATAVAQAGDRSRALQIITEAETLARTITHPHVPHGPGFIAEPPPPISRALADLRAFSVDRADQITADVEELAWVLTFIPTALQARLLTELAAAAVQAGDSGRGHRLMAGARALATEFRDENEWEEILTGLVAAAAQAGDPDYAESIAADITWPTVRALVLSELAIAVVQAGDLEAADKIITETAAFIRGGLGHPISEVRALVGLARAAIQAGKRERARQIIAEAYAITRTDAYAGTMTPDIAVAASQIGDLELADQIIAESKANALAVGHPTRRAERLIEVTAATIRTGQLDQACQLIAEAETAVRTLAHPSDRTALLVDLAAAAAQVGDLDHAEAIARTIIDGILQAQVLASLAAAAARVGRLNHSEAITRSFTDPIGRARILTKLAAVAVEAGDLDRAAQLATDAEVFARNVINFSDKAQALAVLASATTQVGDLDHAEAISRAITPPTHAAIRKLGIKDSDYRELDDLDLSSWYVHQAKTIAITVSAQNQRDTALGDLAVAADRAGDSRAARTIARMILQGSKPTGPSRAVAAAAQNGDMQEAEAAAQAIGDAGLRGGAFVYLAITAAQNDNLNRCRHLLAAALTIEPPEFPWWMETVSHFFPSAIRGAERVFIPAYQTRL